jgi:hypothetical protein
MLWIAFKFKSTAYNNRRQVVVEMDGLVHPDNLPSTLAKIAMLTWMNMASYH